VKLIPAIVHGLGQRGTDAASLVAKQREQTDGGRPTVVAEPDSAIAMAYREIARKAAGRLSMQARNKAIAFPSIVVQNT